MGKYIGITAALALIAYMGTVGALVDYLFPPQAEVAEISSSLVGEPAADSLMPPAERMFPFYWPVGDEPVATAMAQVTR